MYAIHTPSSMDLPTSRFLANKEHDESLCPFRLVQHIQHRRCKQLCSLV